MSKDKITFIYVLYHNGHYDKIDIARYKYSKKIKMCLVPLDVIGKGVYLPVNPELFGDFHHGKISLTIRHNIIDWDQDDDTSDNTWKFNTTKEFTNVLDFVIYLHTIHRITGMERLKAYGTSDTVDIIQVFDIPYAEAYIYDENNLCIFHKKHKNFDKITAMQIEHDSYFIRHNSDACEKFNEIISIFRLVPFESNGICINKHKRTWQFNREGDYCHDQFIPMEDFHCFYLNRTSYFDLLGNILAKQDSVLRVQTYLITSFDVEGAAPELFSTALQEIIETGECYYTSTDYSNLCYPCMLEFLVCYRIFSQYSILEAMYCIFEDPSIQYNLVISVELTFNNRVKKLLIPSNYYPNDVKYVMEDLLL